MNLLTICGIGFGLAMDALAISIANTMCYKNINKKFIALTAIFFGISQGIMPMIGFFLGKTFMKNIEKIYNYVSLIILGYIGVKMIVETVKKSKINYLDGKKINSNVIFAQGIATSIDAFVVGINFSAIPDDQNIFEDCVIISIITIFCCLIGGVLGKRIGKVLEKKAEILGGIILIIIGLKIFFENSF